ncbi:putative endoglucanase [Calothrix sp. NIES-4071]|nr:putative endoglucanase [Calothrix sp. NIES-4071]BAZ59454.1 putative endoglucanase [Calothrix sp. NIES-4105]
MHTLSRSKFLRLALLSICSGLAAANCSIVKATNESKFTFKASRLNTLSKGFNLEHWQGHELTDGFYTQASLLEYKSLGLTYTRLPVVLWRFLNDNNPSVLKTDYLAALDTIVQMHVNTGLGIIVSPFNHPYELYSDPVIEARFIAFWKAFASHLSSTDPEKVFLEVMNEPSAKTAEDWNKVQVKLIAAIRSGAPNHTIIASSNLRVAVNDWDNIQALLDTQIVEDKNVVYNFHCYVPFVFTHQGATWGWHALQFMKNIPYPSTPQAVAPMLSSIRDSEAKSAVENYGKEEWNKDKFLKVLSPIAEWAKTNEVSVICNEFGAIPWVAPRDSMLRYLKDITQVFETYGIGWGHWFGLNMQDTEVMQALGLKPLL